jgi:Glycosyl transferase family 2
MSIPASSQPRRSGVAAYLATLDTMTDLAAPRTAEVAARPTRRCVLDIVIPVHNEERDLPGSVRRLHRYLVAEVPYPSRITITDNASTDNTLAVAEALAEELSDVEVIHVDEKGRGGALYTAWMASEADVVAYMDVDLSTDLSALMPLVAPLISGHSDVAIGSRFGGVVAGGARAETRIRLSQLQLDPAWCARRPLLRCTVRLQSGPRQRGAPAAAACRRHRLVL